MMNELARLTVLYLQAQRQAARLAAADEALPDYGTRNLCARRRARRIVHLTAPRVARREQALESWADSTVRDTLPVAA